MGAVVIGGRLLEWLFTRSLEPERTERIDRALARNLTAQERVAREADAVVEAATASRQRTEAAREQIRETVKHRPRHRSQTGDVRAMVEDMLRHIDAPREQNEDPRQ